MSPRKKNTFFSN